MSTSYHSLTKTNGTANTKTTKCFERTWTTKVNLHKRTGHKSDDRADFCKNINLYITHKEKKELKK